jgi:hypothetical protein
MGVLTKEQLDSFNENGYLVIPDFFDPEPLKTQAQKLLSDFNSKDHAKSIFTTSDENHIGDHYFLTSHNKIRYFMEEKGDPGSVVVNKIGTRNLQQVTVYTLSILCSSSSLLIRRLSM